MLKRIYLIAFVFLTSCTQSETIYTLSASANPSEGGTVQPLSQDYPEGSTAVVVASVSDEYQFDDWTGDIQNGQLDIVDGRNVFTVVMDSDKNVVANFVKKKYALTVKTEGEGSVTEKVIKAGVATDYNSGTVVELTAVPEGEWLFVEWTGDLTGSDNPKEITIDKAKTVTAVFVKKQYPLTIEIEGEGTVSEKVIKQGLATDYNSGTIVELTAEPTSDWEFLEWTGDITGTDNPSQITINEAKTVTAVFIKKKYPLTIEIEGEGTVTQTVIKEGITTDYNSGTIVELTAIPTGDWEFVEWQGNLTGNENPIQLTVDSPKTVKVVFIKNPIYLDDNGITIKAKDWANIGDVGIINNVRYTVVNNALLKEAAQKGGEALTNIVTTRVTDMSNLFAHTSKAIGKISSWDTSSVTNMYQMFVGVSWFNGSSNEGWSLSNWDVSNVTNMQAMFSGTKFNEDISNWDVSNVIDMNSMFSYIEEFNQPLNNWNVSSVKNFTLMFFKTSFNFPLDNWDVSNAEHLVGLFRDTPFNQDISNWDVSSATDITGLFRNTPFNQDISNWDVSKVKRMEQVFEETTHFNQDISNWDVSSVSQMEYMFKNSKAFNQDLSKWCVSNISQAPRHFAYNSIFEPENHPTWGTCPKTSIIIDKGVYTVSYNEVYEQPNWVKYTVNNRPKNVDRGGLTLLYSDVTILNITLVDMTFKP